MKRERGVSMVEMLVGVAIGMISIVVVMETYLNFEGRKRVNTTGNDATTAGAHALFQLTREIQTAGYGITTTPVSAPAGSLGTPGFPTILGCSTSVYYNPRLDIPPVNAPQITKTVRVAPVVIEDGGSGSDSITVMYGSADALSTPVEFATPHNSPYDAFNLKSNVGLNVRDVVLVAEMSPSATPAIPCYVAQVTGPGGGPGTPLNAAGLVQHAISGPFNRMTFMSPIVYLEPRLINLGQRPQAITYSVVPPTATQAGQLVATDLLRSSTTRTVVTDDVVNLQAQYGVDTDQDDAIDQWVEPKNDWAATALTPLKISQIKAIRLALLVRASQPEKPDAGGNCSASPETLALGPLLPATGGTIGAPASDTPDLAAVADWRCYRYRNYVSTVPVRNMIWSGQ